MVPDCDFAVTVLEGHRGNGRLGCETHVFERSFVYSTCHSYKELPGVTEIRWSRLGQNRHWQVNVHT